MQSNYIYWIGMAFGLIAVAYLAATNTALVELHGFGSPLHAPMAAIVLGSYSCGILTVSSFWRSFAARVKRGEEKMVQWDKQDVKLMQEVASDEVKLLKAKIDTLEVALTKALKKKDS